MKRKLSICRLPFFLIAAFAVISIISFAFPQNADAGLFRRNRVNVNVAVSNGHHQQRVVVQQQKVVQQRVVVQQQKVVQQRVVVQNVHQPVQVQRVFVQQQNVHQPVQVQRVLVQQQNVHSGHSHSFFFRN